MLVRRSLLPLLGALVVLGVAAPTAMPVSLRPVAKTNARLGAPAPAGVTRGGPTATASSLRTEIRALVRAVFAHPHDPCRYVDSDKIHDLGGHQKCNKEYVPFFRGKPTTINGSIRIRHPAYNDPNYATARAAGLEFLVDHDDGRWLIGDID